MTNPYYPPLSPWRPAPWEPEYWAPEGRCGAWLGEDEQGRGVYCGADATATCSGCGATHCAVCLMPVGQCLTCTCAGDSEG